MEFVPRVEGGKVISGKGGRRVPWTVGKVRSDFYKGIVPLSFGVELPPFLARVCFIDDGADETLSAAVNFEFQFPASLMFVVIGTI